MGLVDVRENQRCHSGLTIWHLPDRPLSREGTILSFSLFKIPPNDSLGVAQKIAIHDEMEIAGEVFGNPFERLARAGLLGGLFQIRI
ncbi:MAG: hypothetical protein ACKO26_27555 [Planctomycetota bacterium]